MNLIMLCGQGSSGKSTFGFELIKNLSMPTELIRVDTLDANLPMPTRISMYIDNIQKACNNQTENVIMDLAQDSVSFRNQILSNLDFSQINIPIHFYAISLRPGIEKIVEWDTRRKNLISLSEEQIALMTDFYNRFEFPTEQEFKKHPFNTITTFELNNINLSESVKFAVNKIEKKDNN